MPGILKKSGESRKTSEQSKNLAYAKSINMAGESKRKSVVEDRSNGRPQLDGGHDMANGVYTNGNSAITTESQSNTLAAMDSLVGQLPPEIEHITYGYLPFSKLITRLVQDTFNGLTDVITDMSDLQVPQSNHHAPHNHLNSLPNGIATGNSSQANFQKKLRMLDFAQDRRSQFIKILVLSQWSRQAEAIGKVIDLRVWLDGQRRIYDDAANWTGELKRILAPRKMLNPDLKTALEALSLGKASWLPDLGYIPPKPLSPQQLLKALRNINTLLSIRLNLHEIIPPPFRDFSISSGRARFRVPEEFEIELSIADEDPSKQLYFIDFRFLFSPSLSEIPQGGLRDQIEGRTNHVLGKEGLSGCFDFLHDLVLTHKLTVLRQQAYEMLRGHWSEHLKVESAHRSLVVQYWLHRPGGKNWVEIGIKSGRRTVGARSSTNQGVPYIALRWFRDGKEIADVKIKLELGVLSMEGILKRVIAGHTTFILKETSKKLREGLLYSKRALSLLRASSVDEPTECSLSVQLTTEKSVEITQEPISGAFALQPTSPLHTYNERILNTLSKPATDAASRIMNLRCVAAVEEIEELARFFGWTRLKTLTPNQDTMKRLFPPDTLNIRFFRRTAWMSCWALAFTSSMTGDFWWMTETQDSVTTGGKVDPMSRPGLVLQTAYKVHVEVLKYSIMKPTYSLLAHVERIAAGMISQYVDIRYLTQEGIPHVVRPSRASGVKSRSATLYLRFKPGEAPKALQSPRRMSIPWANEIIKFTYHGLDAASNSAIHVASVLMPSRVPNIKSLMSAMDPSIAFHPSAITFSIRLLSPLGQPTIPQLLAKLKSIERLIRFLSIIKQYHLHCSAISLSHLEFDYATVSYPLSATIHFPVGAPMHISFPTGNVHLRIQDYLTSLLNDERGLQHMTSILLITLPLMRAFFDIDAMHAKSEKTFILPRSAEWYQIRYKSPNGLFDIKMRQRRDTMMWHVKDLDASRTNMPVAEGMKKGEGWWSIKGGWIASADGVEDLMRRIDEVFRGGGWGDGSADAGEGDGHEIVVLD